MATYYPVAMDTPHEHENILGMFPKYAQYDRVSLAVDGVAASEAYELAQEILACPDLRLEKVNRAIREHFMHVYGSITPEYGVFAVRNRDANYYDVFYRDEDGLLISTYVSVHEEGLNDAVNALVMENLLYRRGYVQHLKPQGGLTPPVHQFAPRRPLGFHDLEALTLVLFNQYDVDSFTPEVVDVLRRMGKALGDGGKFEPQSEREREVDFTFREMEFDDRG